MAKKPCLDDVLSHKERHVIVCALQEAIKSYGSCAAVTTLTPRVHEGFLRQAADAQALLDKLEA